jgi:hypothetical protein
MITNGSISIYNDGIYFARFTVSFKKNGISYSLITDSFSIGEIQTLVIPNGSCCGQVIAEMETFIGLWDQIFSLNFNLPYEKCFTVGGIIFFPSWFVGC